MNMKRTAITQLYAWKDSKDRKPLIVRGARQVGKTWLIEYFAKEAYNKYVYVNFEDDEVLNHIFEADFDIDRILRSITLRTGKKIDESTLLIFDEIQAAPRGVMSLKYFCEKRRSQPIIAAGSLLGICLHKGDSFPVGKVDFLDLYPMTFQEFLLAMGHKDYADLIQSKDWLMIEIIKDRLIELLKNYYFIGGMPEVVLSFATNHDYDKVRAIQNSIISSYEYDFSKHAPVQEVPRIMMVWNSIPGQLAKENKKFVYGALKDGARAKEFEMAIEWLIDAGLIYKVCRNKRGELPLNAFEDLSAFKLFMVDVGLLCAMNKIQPTVLLNGNELFSTHKGALTEEFVYQELRGRTDFVYYWSAENSTGEIDFLIQKGDKVIPIEAKAEENLKSKSLRSFVSKYPGMHGIRFSMSDYREQDWMTNIPLYAISI